MLILAALVAASCQSAPVAGQGGGAQGVGGQGHDGGELQTQKAEILKHLNKALADIQKRQGCVETANDQRALSTCMEPDTKEFQAQKGEILKHMNEAHADQQTQSCVQAANDPQALSACMPQQGGARAARP